MQSFDVAAVNARERVAILENDHVVHLENLFDKSGVETQNVAEAVSASGMSAYGSLTLDLIAMRAHLERQGSQSLH